MKKYTKNYIGKGTQIEGLDIVRVTLKVEELLKVTHKYDGVEYLTFEIAKMQSKDDFGRTHTCYVSVKETVKEEESAQEKEARKADEKAAKKAAKKDAKTKEPELEMEPADQDIPF